MAVLSGQEWLTAEALCQGDPDDLIMEPTTAMIAWLRTVPWFFA